MSDAPDLRVVFVGDSFVAGIGDPDGRGWVGRVVASACASGIALTADNLGIGGDTSADVVHRWQTDVLPVLAAATDRRVVLSFGANDATLEAGTTRVDASASVAHLEWLLTQARELGLGAFFVGPPPYGDERQHERIVELSLQLSRVAAAFDVPFVDVAGAVAGSPLWRAEADAGDGAHPAAGGYALLAGLLADPIVAWLRAPLG